MEFGEDPLLQQYLQQIHGVHCQVLDDCSCNNPKKKKNKSNISRNFLFSSSLPQKKKKKKKLMISTYSELLRKQSSLTVL